MLPAGFAIQPGMQVAQQQPGGQFILTNMAATPGAPVVSSASTAGGTVKSGSQSMMTTTMAQGNNAAGKAIAGSQAYTLAPGNTLVTATGANGAPQTFIMAGNPIQQQQQQQMPKTDTKPTTGTPPQPPQGQQAQQQQPQQQVLFQQGGMTYLNPNQGQAIMQNGQLIFRAPTPAPQDASQAQPQQQLMFSPPQGTPGMPGVPQQLLPQNAAMQPMTMPVVSGAAAAGSLRPPTSTSSISTGKKALPPILPTTGASPRPNLSMLPQQPKSKSSKMSPRVGGGGVIGRPPGPAKSILSNLKSQSNNTTPPRLPGSPVSASGNNTALIGPPVLQQTSSAVLPPPSTLSLTSTPPQFTQPPKLQPMMNNVEPAAANLTTKTEPGIAKDEPSTGPKQAVVKPNVNVLSHYIDGHQILESSQPFPIDKEDKGEFRSIEYSEIS